MVPVDLAKAVQGAGSQRLPIGQSRTLLQFCMSELVSIMEEELRGCRITSCVLDDDKRLMRTAGEREGGSGWCRVQVRGESSLSGWASVIE